MEIQGTVKVDMGTIYVCYHENSFELEPEEGKISNMIATNDIRGALEWMNESIRKAKEENYQFTGAEDVVLLYEALVANSNSISTVYKNGDKNSKEYYRICVNSYS